VFGNTSSGNALSVQQLGAGNVVAFSNASGNVGLVVSSTSNVGIGVTNPLYPLEIRTDPGGVNPTDTALRLFSVAYATGTSNTSLRIEKGNGYGGLISGYISQGVGSGLQLSTLGGGGTQVDNMTLTSGGRVGIGTASPYGILHVDSGGAASNIATAQPMASGALIAGAVTGAIGQSGEYSPLLQFRQRWFTTTDTVATGGISGRKDNGSGGYGGGLQFWYGPNGSSTLSPGMALDWNGRVGIGSVNPSTQLTVQNNQNIAGAVQLANFLNYGGTGVLALYDPGNANIGTGWNGASSCVYLAKNNASGRSLNAAGVIGGGGGDYAEYVTKTSDFTIKKGDVAGVNSHGLLTNVFTESVSFVIKSTDPCIVGGDTWGTEEALGVTRPNDVPETDPGYADYQAALARFNAKLEEARARVDRIAFAGQVPVNVLGATPGQYIVPVANEDGSISGQAVSNPTFEQYMAAVGKVIKVLPDGRAHIIVKVV
jgi:hypothetical protein